MDSLTEHTASLYKGCCIVLTTKHHKSIALAAPFEKILGAGMLEHPVDTDQLGTFSGEIERKASPLETARKKCEWSLTQTKADYVLASEGSFGPHPFIPFIPGNHEILYFVDNVRKFHLHVSATYTETNYRMADIVSWDVLEEFAKKALFPSHALIISASSNDGQKVMFKGIDTYRDLECAFSEAQRFSHDHTVHVETDMRAHFNPTRMRMIGLLGEVLAKRLSMRCPQCQTPGWGKVDIQIGLLCGECGSETGEIRNEIWGCPGCSYRALCPPSHGKEKAEPAQCPYCNP